MSKANDNAVKRSTDPVKKVDSPEKGKIFQRIAQWFRDLKGELKKVVWPTRSQVINNTIVALVVIVISSVVIWGFDTLAQEGIKAIVSLV